MSLLPVYVRAVLYLKKKNPVAGHKTTIECFSPRGIQSLTVGTGS